MANARSVFQREIMYDDGSGPELSVRLDSEYKLCGDRVTDEERAKAPAYVQIEGVGSDPVAVRADYIPQLVEMLQDAAAMYADTLERNRKATK